MVSQLSAAVRLRVINWRSVLLYGSIRLGKHFTFYLFIYTQRPRAVAVVVTAVMVDGVSDLTVDNVDDFFNCMVSSSPLTTSTTSLNTATAKHNTYTYSKLHLYTNITYSKTTCN